MVGGKIALAKILTGLAFTVELFALLAVSSVISHVVLWELPDGICRFRISN